MFPLYCPGCDTSLLKFLQHPSKSPSVSYNSLLSPFQHRHFEKRCLKAQEKWKEFRYTFYEHIPFLFTLLSFSFCWKARCKRTWHHFQHVDSSGFLKCYDPWKARIHAYLHSSLRLPWPGDGEAGCWCSGWACWITPEPQLWLPLSECQPALPSLFLPATWPSPICYRIHKVLKITNIWTYYR